MYICLYSMYIYIYIHFIYIYIYKDIRSNNHPMWMLCISTSRVSRNVPKLPYLKGHGSLGPWTALFVRHLSGRKWLIHVDTLPVFLNIMDLANKVLGGLRQTQNGNILIIKRILEHQYDVWVVPVVPQFVT